MLMLKPFFVISHPNTLIIIAKTKPVILMDRNIVQYKTF